MCYRVVSVGGAVLCSLPAREAPRAMQPACAHRGERAVVACSALKPEYRRVLAGVEEESGEEGPPERLPVAVAFVSRGPRHLPARGLPSTGHRVPCRPGRPGLPWQSVPAGGACRGVS